MRASWMTCIALVTTVRAIVSPLGAQQGMEHDSAMRHDAMSKDAMGHGAMSSHDPATAPKATVDRFSATAGHLQRRTADNGIPQPNAPVDFDHGPFITQGHGPKGQPVMYYNFDAQPSTAAPVYVLVHSGTGAPVEQQLPIIDALPGDTGYSDLHQVIRVTVPADYHANTITSAKEIENAGWSIERTTTIVNDPIVPEGSRARFGVDGHPAPLRTAWYRGQTARFLEFEQNLKGDAAGTVPVSPIFVTFVKNPGEPDGGPGSGFKTEAGSKQTHNVIATAPGDPGYSPLWQVSVYDNGAFQLVSDLNSVGRAKILAQNVALVNCPVVH
jgi:hypothetical protein